MSLKNTQESTKFSWGIPGVTKEVKFDPVRHPWLLVDENYRTIEITKIIDHIRDKSIHKKADKLERMMDKIMYALIIILANIIICAFIFAPIHH